MAIVAEMLNEGASWPAPSPGGIDLESSHKVINALVEVLQRHFKEEKKYSRPLMPPQANILFALDKETAEAMVVYMTDKLRGLAEFEDGEFRFTRKSASSEEVLQRIRLEFPEGVNVNMLRKMLAATEKLERSLPACQA